MEGSDPQENEDFGAAFSSDPPLQEEAVVQSQDLPVQAGSADSPGESSRCADEPPSDAVPETLAPSTSDGEINSGTEQPPASPPEAPGPSSSPSPSSSLPQTVFHIKQFDTNLKKQSVILQSVNGPCPLIAIVNSLLIQQRLDLPSGSDYISAVDLCSLLGNYLLDRAQKPSPDTSTSHTEQYILDCLERFVQIQTGIDINVKFNSVDGFEYTPELSLFDLAEVRLVHGWVVDPQDAVLAGLVKDLTYNQIVEETMSKSCSADTRLVSESLLLKDHLESSQLTVHGICEINGSMSTGDVVVLFRNNHFSTITKQNDRLYVLVTDIGWQEQEQVIWETLDSTCNSSTFVDGFYKSTQIEPAQTAPALHGQREEEASTANDAEYAMSLELQISKEEQEEQQRLWDEAKSNRNSETQPQQRSRSDKDRDKKSSSNCTVM